VQGCDERGAAQHEGAENGGERGCGRSKLESFHDLLASFDTRHRIHHARNRATRDAVPIRADGPVDKFGAWRADCFRAIAKQRSTKGKPIAQR
jgi:hypothetical protein